MRGAVVFPIGIRPLVMLGKMDRQWRLDLWPIGDTWLASAERYRSGKFRICNRERIADAAVAGGDQVPIRPATSVDGCK